MKKVLCILLCCVLVIPFLSGCSKKDPLAGTMWINERDDESLLVFFEDGKYARWTIDVDLGKDRKAWLSKELNVGDILEPVEYKIIDEGKVYLAAYQGDYHNEYDFAIEGNYLRIFADTETSAGHTNPDRVYKRIKSFEEFAKFHNCEWIEEE